ncbi:MAG TPA: LysR substrate-binding domain-containing protein [Terriglobales bacterium]|jgi:LysR family transcriptional regulator, hydrogen peroxide-inducible genes activator|nr:LysR substrate-binding domain-containing protein [Terriglobales bacterium]
MEVHQLRYFCAVAETGSFTRAAEREQVAQPSLSQQIMKLEEELSVRLFDRLGRSVRLTDLGQIFLPRARAILMELKAAKEEVAERQSTVSGPVSVGVIPTIAPYFMPTRLALFSRKYPQASVTVVEDVTVRLLDRLRAGLIDLAVMALPARGHDLECFPLRTERLYAILPRGHRLAKKRSLHMKELRGEPFVLLRDDHCFRETAIEVCKRARVLPQVIFESGQFSSIVGMVAAGLGISLIPEMALEQRPDCNFVLVSDERANRTVGVATLKGRFLSRVQRAFLMHLRSSAHARPAQ